MSLLLTESELPGTRGAFLHLSVPKQFIFNPLIVEFFMVMVAAFSDVSVVLVGSVFSSTAGCTELHFLLFQTEDMFSDQCCASTTHRMNLKFQNLYPFITF